MHVSRSPRFCGEEDGSALVTVLLFIVAVSILVGAVLLVHVLQRRLVVQDVQSVQARYAAEGAVYRALDDLRGDLTERTFTFEGDGGAQCSVRVEPFGGFARVRSSASVGRQTVRLKALAGHRPPPSFDNAIVLGDRSSSLTLTGAVRIRGDVQTGMSGVETSSIRGQPFTGVLQGVVRRDRGRLLPRFDASVFEDALDRADERLRVPPSGARVGPDAIGGARAFDLQTHPRVDGRRVVYVDGSLTLTEADSSLSAEPVLVLARRSIRLQGRFRVHPNSIFVAGSTLRIQERVRGEEAVFVGLQGTFVGGTARVSGQFLSRRNVFVGGAAVLPFPSVVYGAFRQGQIRIGGTARVDGLVASARERERTDANDGSVVLRPDARVRGAVYNAGRSEVQGTLDGALLSQQVGFYRSPTYYVNWLSQAAIDRTSRPDPFVVPFGFEGAPRPSVLYWNESASP